MPEPYAVRMDNGEGKRFYRTKKDYQNGVWSASMNASKRRKRALGQ